MQAKGIHFGFVLMRKSRSVISCLPINGYASMGIVTQISRLLRHLSPCRVDHTLLTLDFNYRCILFTFSVIIYLMGLY